MAEQIKKKQWLQEGGSKRINAYQKDEKKIQRIKWCAIIYLEIWIKRQVKLRWHLV